MREESAASAPVKTVSRKRGIVYIKWGKTDATIRRSIESVRAFHPELPVWVRELPDNATLLEKAAMMEFTPFEETLYLDLDTVVLGRLDFGFDMAVRHGLACCICECPWARRYEGIKTGELVDYNTGVLFFTRKARPIFDMWLAKARVTDSSAKYYGPENRVDVSPFNDQAPFALAVAEAPTLPFVLPLNWNFRPVFQRNFWGPIKIWHDYSAPPQKLLDFTKAQSRPDSIIHICSL